ncbi:hypothetical protein A2U01_0077781, partial [Trifolium medium]|nr:hypothetical protein [Trifolium medium]
MNPRSSKQAAISRIDVHDLEGDNEKLWTNMD